MISVRNKPALSLSLSLSKDLVWLLWFLQWMWASQLLWRSCDALLDHNIILYSIFQEKLFMVWNV